MNLDKADQIYQTFMAAVSCKSPFIVHRISELQGYSFEQIEIALKLRISREYQLCADEPSASAAFQNRIKSYGALACCMRGQFVPDSEIEKSAHLSSDSREFKYAMSSLSTAWMNDKDYECWLENETIESFTNYCQHIGVDDPLYWQKVYIHLGLPYELDSPNGDQDLVLDPGGSIKWRLPTNQDVASKTQTGIPRWIGFAVIAGIVIIFLYSTFL